MRFDQIFNWECKVSGVGLERERDDSERWK